MANTQIGTDGQDRQQQVGTGMLSRGQQPGVINRRQQSSPVSLWEPFTGSPFALMRRMSEEMDRMFGDWGPNQNTPTSLSQWSPAIEVAQRDGNYVVHAELPGLKPEEVNVEVADDALIIQGERKSQQEQNQGGIQRSERRYGQFYRSIPLPDGVNADQVQATFQNGVLEVRVPMPQQQSNRRQIPIQPGSASSETKPTH
jgi:HSP20 family protein